MSDISQAVNKSLNSPLTDKPRKQSNWTEDWEVETTQNSAEFDRKSYEADGGDAWIDSRREEFFTNPQGVDEGLWSKAKDASQAAYGKVKWQFVTWMYKKLGGVFK